MTDSRNYDIVTSENHKPIKMWTRGVQVETSAMQQLVNVASLPFIYRYIAAMPDVHYGWGATVGSVIPTLNVVIPAAVGADIGCFVGQTKVPLLNGRQMTLREMADRNEIYWVYSIDTKSLNVVPGKAVAVKTRQNASLVKVVVSGGEEIMCTPDHQFMTNKGTYIEAKDLKRGDSLMPLYRKWNTRDGYESSTNGIKGNSKLTHKRVYEHFCGETEKGFVIHHKDGDLFNNNPGNLESLSASEHSSYHAKKTSFYNKNSSKEFQEKRIEGMRKYWDSPDGKEKMSRVGSENIRKYMEEKPDHYAESIKDNGKRGAKYLKKFNTSPRECDVCGEVLKNPSTLLWHKRREHEHENNHKVISVDTLDYTEDVYCLQVEKYNNFALAAGVFVHNCGVAGIRLDGIDKEKAIDSAKRIRRSIERNVPVGYKSFSNRLVARQEDIMSLNGVYIDDIMDFVEGKHPDIGKGGKSPLGDIVTTQFGTLGGGNHFIELCFDENDSAWVVVHTGSRNIGKRISDYFIDRAKKTMERYYIDFLPDKDLAFFPKGSEDYHDYMFALNWAQAYAYFNRSVILHNSIEAIFAEIGEVDTDSESYINCHHNYASIENHYGKNVLITRKGATRARKDDMVIIPGSMGTETYIGKGKGNPESYHSCSHGAGRIMGRREAERRFTVQDLEQMTEGVECRKDADVIDEIPSSYKDINSVMNAQSDLVETLHVLKQIVCVKGVGKRRKKKRV